MASAWGDAWGVSWGDAWGKIASSRGGIDLGSQSGFWPAGTKVIWYEFEEYEEPVKKLKKRIKKRLKAAKVEPKYTGPLLDKLELRVRGEVEENKPTTRTEGLAVLRRLEQEIVTELVQKQMNERRRKRNNDIAIMLLLA